MLITRPFDRPVVIDETNFHYLAVAVVGPHAEAAGRRSASRCCATPRPAPSCAHAVENYNRDPAQGHDRPAAAVDAVYVDEVTPARARRSARRARSPTSPTSWASRRPTRCSTSRSPRTSRPSSAGAPRARSGRDAVGEAQLDPRMVIGTSDGGAHLARDDGADWSSYFLALVGARPQGVDARGGHPPDHAGAGRAARPRRPRARSSRAAGPTCWSSTPTTIGPWTQGVRARPARRRRPVQGVGPGRARDDRQRRADRAGTASSPAGCRARWCAPDDRRAPRHRSDHDPHRTDTTARRNAPWIFDADGHIVEPRVDLDELLPAKFRDYAPRVIQFDDHFRFVCDDRIGFRIHAPRRVDGRAGSDRPRDRRRRSRSRGGTEPGAAARRHGRRPHRRRRAVPDVRADDPGRHRTRARARAVPRDQRLAGRVLRARPDAAHRRRDPADDRRRRRARRGDAAASRSSASGACGAGPSTSARSPHLQDESYEPLWSYLEEVGRPVRDPSRAERRRALRRAAAPLRRLLHGRCTPRTS